MASSAKKEIAPKAVLETRAAEKVRAFLAVNLKA
jgi:hypothetical protein